MDTSEAYSKSSLNVFESVLRITMWILLGLQIIVVLFFGTIEIQSYDLFGRLNTVKSVPNPAVIWLTVLMVATYFSWILTAKKTGKMRFWWLGLIAVFLSGGVIFLTKDKESTITYRAPEQEYLRTPEYPKTPYQIF